MNMSRLIGRRVRQTSATLPACQKFVGREATVQDAFEDEKGAVQVQTNDGVWCPLALLALVGEPA
jgi:membrane protein implicated in regulation of membrane protease activity